MEKNINSVINYLRAENHKLKMIMLDNGSVEKFVAYLIVKEVGTRHAETINTIKSGVLSRRSEWE